MTVDGRDVVRGIDVAVAAIPMRLEASDRPRGDAVAALFRNAGAAAELPGLRVRFEREPIASPPGPCATSVDDVSLWWPSRGELVAVGRDGLSARATADELVVAGAAPRLAAGFRFMAFIGLSHVLAERGRHMLHAGALVRDGRTVLVLGGAGCGKSTLVLAGLRRGWAALADDMVVGFPIPNGFAVVGFPRPISIAPDVVDFDGGRAVPADARGRVELPVADTDPQAHRVSGVVVAALGTATQATACRLDGQGAFRAVIGASTSLVDPALRPQVFALGAALARLPAWSLAHGTDAERRLASAADRLDEIGRAL